LPSRAFLLAGKKERINVLWHPKFRHAEILVRGDATREVSPTAASHGRALVLQFFELTGIQFTR